MFSQIEVNFHVNCLVVLTFKGYQMSTAQLWIHFVNVSNVLLDFRKPFTVS